MKKPLISIIIPAYNEEENIERVHQELTQKLDPLPYDFEYIFVDNRSTDRTPEMMRKICQADSRWKMIRFTRNFNVEMSMTAGYLHAKGDAMIVLYSDLQDPPEVIPRFIEKWQEGYDIVYGTRTVRKGDPAWRNWVVKWVYRAISYCSEVPIPKNAGDFRLISSRVRDALALHPEANRFMRGLIASLGFNQTGIEYERKPRMAGTSKAPVLNMIVLTFGAITSFSLKPLRLFTAFGFVVLGISSVLFLIYTIGFFFGDPPRGTTTIIGLGLIGIGLNSLGIGILGEYLGRTYAEVKRRPLFLIDEMVGITPKMSETVSSNYILPAQESPKPLS